MQQYHVFMVPPPSSFLVVDISPEREFVASVIAGRTLSGGG
jgi:hypothetical protein